MIITCSQCQAKFKIAPEQIKVTGSKVRCSNCKYVFTVFRPRKGAEKAAERPVGEESDQHSSLSGDGRRADPYGLGDLFDDQTAGRTLDGRVPDDLGDDDDFEDPEDGLDEFMETDDEGPHLRPADEPVSLKERRDRRRQLYSDLEDEPGRSTLSEDDDIFDDEYMEEGGRPPLRRAAQSRAASDRDDDDLEEYDDDGYEESEAADQADDSLGLAADPVEAQAAHARMLIDDAEYQSKGLAGGVGQGASIRAAVTKESSRSPYLLIIGLIVLAGLLAGGIYYFSSRPAPTALSNGDNVALADDPPPPTDPGRDDGDQAGTKKIAFTEGKQGYYFFNNPKAGKLLVITGMVRNNYPERRNFIRLRGHLLNGEGKNLADRFVFAGNILSEEELTTLPILEITTRLSLKGGQRGLNMNVAPGQEIPFMLVFDKLPEGIAEYRIDAVSSVLAK